MGSPTTAWEGHNGGGIREIRKVLDMSLREFSEVVGIPKSTLADMEKGKISRRNGDALKSVCSYLENLPIEPESKPRAKQSASRITRQLKRFIEEE
jgi:transcriptional regulator with XRE-family HTH domain